MKKLLAIAIAVLMLFVTGCDYFTGGNLPITTEKFVLKAVVKSVSDSQMEVEAIESEYAFGPYIVHLSSASLLDTTGSEINISAFKEGDVVEITYGGQVMMSYPPQIVAYKVQKVQ